MGVAFGGRLWFGCLGVGFGLLVPGFLGVWGVGVVRCVSANPTLTMTELSLGRSKEPEGA